MFLLWLSLCFSNSPRARARRRKHRLERQPHHHIQLNKNSISNSNSNSRSLRLSKRTIGPTICKVCLLIDGCLLLFCCSFFPSWWAIILVSACLLFDMLPYLDFVCLKTWPFCLLSS